jgi:archaellum biogenesis ATPase FlaH
MPSKLIITPIEKLDKETIKIVKSLPDIPVIYIALNKTQKSIEELLIKNGIDIKKIFFIDCVTPSKIRGDVLYLHPTQLGDLYSAIEEFTKKIKGKKFLILDALSTLLIYNNQKKVEDFLDKVTQKSDIIEMVFLTPQTKGRELPETIHSLLKQRE